MLDQNTNKAFFDSNIVIYLYSSKEIDKFHIARVLVEQSKKLMISTQVLNEFAHVMNSKKKISFTDIHDAVKQLYKIFNIVNISVLTIEKALNIATKYKYSYFDALMLATALENKCNIFYTEDLHHHQVIEDSLKIVNPFYILEK